jgi:hypothetical protein
MLRGRLASRLDAGTNAVARFVDARADAFPCLPYAFLDVNAGFARRLATGIEGVACLINAIVHAGARLVE